MGMELRRPEHWDQLIQSIDQQHLTVSETLYLCVVLLSVSLSVVDTRDCLTVLDALTQTILERIPGAKNQN